MPEILLAKELIADDSNPLTESDFLDGCIYSAHPAFLDYSLTLSMERMNIDCLDCAMLYNPFEKLKQMPKFKSHQQYLYALANAF